MLILVPALAQAQCTLSPPLNLGPDAKGCDNVPTTLDAGGPYNSYSWSTGSTAQTITVNSSGTYIVTVTDTAGCTGSDTLVYTSYPAPVANLGPDIDTCNTPIVILDCGVSGAKYTWNDNTHQQTLGVIFDGTYIVVVTDSSGTCSSTDTVAVAFHTSDPAPSLGQPVFFCPGFSDTLDAGPGWSSYTWSTGDTGQTLVVTATGNYSVTVTNQWGCPSTSFQLPVTVWAGPAQPTITGNILQLSTDPATSYQWYLDGNPIPNSNSQTIVPTVSGIYTVEVTDANGCVSVLSLPFDLVFEIDESQITQLVTPNGDGANDFFNIPELVSFPDNSLKIMNRWGVEVFSTVNYLNDWGGTTNSGNQLPEGTYYFILDINNGKKPFTGFFQLVR